MAFLHMRDTLEPSENILEYLQIISFIRKTKQPKKFFEKFASLRMRVISLMTFSAKWLVGELIQYLSYPEVSLLNIRFFQNFLIKQNYNKNYQSF